MSKTQIIQATGGDSFVVKNVKISQGESIATFDAMQDDCKAILAHIGDVISIPSLSICGRLLSHVVCCGKMYRFSCGDLAHAVIERPANTHTLRHLKEQQ